ncbi:K(+)-transporting ATPase subunit F [soil metagenome]
MLKILAIVFGVIALFIAAVLGFATSKPDSFEVQRSITIKAAPEKVYALIDDFHRWAEWSPWEKFDPTMQRSFSGAERGKGAAYAWQGNSKVGSGRMEITDPQPPSKIAIQLDFIQPFEGHNVAEFSLQPQADGTQVTWAMRGPTPFVSKVMQVFVSMDQLIGKDFETGLANMKLAAEK